MQCISPLAGCLFAQHLFSMSVRLICSVRLWLAMRWLVMLWSWFVQRPLEGGTDKEYRFGKLGVWKPPRPAPGCRLLILSIIVKALQGPDTNLYLYVHGTSEKDSSWLTVINVDQIKVNNQNCIVLLEETIPASAFCFRIVWIFTINVNTFWAHQLGLNWILKVQPWLKCLP